MSEMSWSKYTVTLVVLFPFFRGDLDRGSRAGKLISESEYSKHSSWMGFRPRELRLDGGFVVSSDCWLEESRGTVVSSDCLLPEPQAFGDRNRRLDKFFDSWLDSDEDFSRFRFWLL